MPSPSIEKTITHSLLVRDLVSMMTSSNGNIFRVTGPLCGEFTGPAEFPAQRPATRSFDVFFDLRLNTQLSKHLWGWWFETPSWSMWRQCNEKEGVFCDEFDGNTGQIVVQIVIKLSYTILRTCYD